MDPSFLPQLNASLNAVAAALLWVGRSLARRRRLVAHRRTMLAAFAVSSLFLISYVAHKASRDFENTTLHVEGILKQLYLGFLLSHVVLAVTIPFLAITLIRLGLTGRFATHRKLARIAWPIWMYVSVTGVMIYVILYHLNPPPLSGAGFG